MFSKWLDPMLLLLTTLALLAGVVAHSAQENDWASFCWAAGSLTMALVLLVEIAGRLARGEAGVDLIALLSISAALFFEQALVAAVIALMLATGRTLEFFTRQRAERELRALIDRAPRFAWLQEKGAYARFPLNRFIQIRHCWYAWERLYRSMAACSARQRFWTSRHSAVNPCP